MNKLQEKAETLKLGLYIHVPFCARSCDFCHFYQEPPKRPDIERYLQGMELSMQQNPLGRPADTAFWGGGTPGLLPAGDLERLCRAMVHANWGKMPGEWSVEMAPATVKRDKIRRLQDQGVNRISMGVQTFHPDLLDQLGRIHSIRQVHEAIEILHDEGMSNFNLDLMFAIPGQTHAMWQADLKQAIAACPAHISTYCLTFEEDTALWLRMKQGVVESHSPEQEAVFHEMSAAILGDAGFEQYEISNYAMPGRMCEHNLNTWRMQEWIGFGPSAASQFNMRRWTEAHSIDEWLEGIVANQPAYAEEQELSRRLIAQDYLIFGLRMNAGVDLGQWQSRFSAAPLPGWEDFKSRLMNEGYGQLEGDRFYLTDQGRLLADRIGMEILELGDDS